MRDLLVDLLIDRTKQDNRSLLQIVLNESLSVAPKLTNDQLAALSVFFLIFSTIERDINSYDSPGQYLDLYIKPFSGFRTKNASCYQHLEYTGCCAIGTGRKILVRLFKDRYSIVFSKGFTKEFLQDQGILVSEKSPIFNQCHYDSRMLQIDALNESDLRDKALQLRINEQEINKLVNLRNTVLIKGNEIRAMLIKLRPYMSKIFDVWMNSLMSHLHLTSVGIAIGHANVKRQLGKFTDLSIWIH